MSLSENWLLRGAGVVALVFAASVNACSSSEDDEGTGGTSGSGGSGASGGSGGSGGDAGEGMGGGAGDASGGTGGGTGGAAGAGAGAGGQGGAAGAMGGAAGQAGGGSDVVTAKFCNNIGFGEEGNPMDITLRLDIGTAPNIVSFSALTGTCTPIDNMPCTTIPGGTDVPVALIDPEVGETPIAQALLTAEPGEEWIFVADVPTDQPEIEGEVVPPGLMCSELTYDDIFAPQIDPFIDPAQSPARTAAGATWRSVRRLALPNASGFDLRRRN